MNRRHRRPGRPGEGGEGIAWRQHDKIVSRGRVRIAQRSPRRPRVVKLVAEAQTSDFPNAHRLRRASIVLVLDDDEW